MLQRHIGNLLGKVKYLINLIQNYLIIIFFKIQSEETVGSSGLDPIKSKAWGSLRFYPEWALKNREICPQFKIDNNASKKLKIVLRNFKKSTIYIMN